MNIKIPELCEVSACAGVYLSAYEKEPWNEQNDPKEVERYIISYLNSQGRCCYCLEDEGQIIGVALGLVIPSLTGPYMRIEDFCIDSNRQRQGSGSLFMDLILQQALELGCDSVLLGTQRNAPSHQFYLKNGFVEVDSVLMYKEICSQRKV